jgi:hypothetical protein
MPWISKTKDLALSGATPHSSLISGVIGRAPGFGTINFGPLDLFGAAARCSHLQLVNPVLSTPESQMIAALVEQYVDDVSNDFAILGTANFKDFVKSYFAGTVAAGLAYLAMIDDGYVWSDHFENIGGGNPTATKTPDFVFAGPVPGVALLESKGTRSAPMSSFDGTVDAGYVGQVEPHLGYSVGGATATHGYCIGSWLTSTTKAELRVHHTAVPAIGGQGSQPSAPVTAIQRQNYATAFALAHSPQFGDEIRRGAARRQNVPFVQIEWAGRNWLTSFAPMGGPWWWHQSLAYLFGQKPTGTWARYLPNDPPPFFAVEQTIAKDVLSRFYGLKPDDDGMVPIEPLPRDPTTRGEGSQSGAVFPDGLAVIRSGFKFARFIEWDPQVRRFEP